MTNLLYVELYAGAKMDKFIFVGNRFFVYEKMINMGLDVTTVYAVRDSFLEKELLNRKIPYEILPGKKEFIDLLMSGCYDYLISNGCPYILPISKLADGHKKFINIHPSLLPDMKGKSPINGALLFHRRHGVTCHYMNDGIDSGNVIAQMEIPLTDDVNLDLLYQISFRLEGAVFEKAYQNGFRPSDPICIPKQPIYYSRNEADRIITIHDGWDKAFSKIRAFHLAGQYLYIMHSGKPYEITGATVITNPVVREMYFDDKLENCICAVYSGKYVLAKIWGMLLQFELLDVAGLAVGESLIR